MFDQSHGLRFDIYERIHLSQDLPGISELEEVELLPDIQVIQREDRAELRGQLLLTGLYRSEDDRTHRLDHAIPVEITVPLARVSSLEEIGVEIENFDIDLLTMRSVNITGVLSLRGIGGSEPVPAWQSEEFTVAYSPEEGDRAIAGKSDAPADVAEGLYENSLWTYGEGSAEDAALEREQIEALGADQAFPGITQEEDSDELPNLNLEEDRYAEIHSENGQPFIAKQETEPSGQWKSPASWSHFAQGGANAGGSSLAGDRKSASKTEDITDTDDEESTDLADASAPVSFDSLAATGSGPAEEQPAPEADSLPETPLSPEEKPDLKIALGSKKDTGQQTKEHLSFSSLLSSGKNRSENEEAAAEKTVSSTAAVTPSESSDDSEWKSRFMRTKDGEQAFRKVRLCIVQREETLDSIAEKYQLSARELVLYNRLSGQTVEEGQVIYIP
ncbi:LysM peptidoglycan-binding domain-containing protein [Paenibacillus sabinae]|uniref:Peptidoglycan-binding lysin n=1 Tax=Paenibacillus sabinae T27 TaxID=1268072 RepID=X5A425_9BACL|nr:LysM peptidoglycan-binding domain-containing protein [Paenibacillus sabinae]AHV98574.1 peptidoglycan-binding lysin [Paenibacillus sabinae T27]